MTPFSISGASIKKGRAAAKDDDFLKELLENEGDDSIVNEENEDDSNPLTDGMITVSAYLGLTRIYGASLEKI